MWNFVVGINETNHQGRRSEELEAVAVWAFGRDDGRRGGQRQTFVSACSRSSYLNYANTLPSSPAEDI